MTGIYNLALNQYGSAAFAWLGTPLPSPNPAARGADSGHVRTRHWPYVIDCRAQADGLIVRALDSLQLLESLAAQGIRFTFLLFPSEDTESMNNLLDLFFFAGDRVDYVVV